MLTALADVRVVELGVWAAAPAAGGILADWGADVVKVESPAGDPVRNIFRSIGTGLTDSPTFVMHNRGKRSIVLDLEVEDDRENLERLLGSCDVLLTNMRPRALARHGLDADAVLVRHPSLIYARMTGLGAAGPQRDRPSYDVGAFWARSGLAHQQGVAGGPPFGAHSGVGDHVTALAAVAGIMAALVERRATGEGQLVDVSLQRVGTYVGSWDLTLQSALGRVLAADERRESITPLLNCYRTGDGRWLFLTALEVERHFPGICEAIGRPELPKDERFESAKAIRRNRRALIAILDEVFETRTLANWTEILDAAGVWWEPVSLPSEVLEDPQLAANDGFLEVDGEEQTMRLPNGPVAFGGRTLSRFPRAPGLGQHTDEILKTLPKDDC